MSEQVSHAEKGDPRSVAKSKVARPWKERWKTVRRWLARVGVILLVAAIVGVGVGIWYVRRPWPQVSGTVHVSGLLASAEVHRDRWGVPHIYAENEHDLFFVQGYVHAQDRLWQMEMNRRISSATLSEVVGRPVVGIDRFIRSLGLRRVAEQTWAAMGDEDRAILEAYAGGVNAYVMTHQGELPLEFTVLGVNPEPWTPIDSLAFANLMALDMGSNRSFELLMAELVTALGEETAWELLPPAAQDVPVIVPVGSETRSGLGDASLDDLAEWDQWRGNPYSSWGSNSWVVHGSRTASGLPILANDTHLGLQMPSLWYENGLHGGRFDSVGFTFPSVPLIVTGHNAYIAWGITNLNPDVQDFYIEKLDDLENPTRYEFEGEWHDLQIIHETITVKGSAPVELDVLFTRHGPILNMGDVRKGDEEPLALRWTLFEGNDLLGAIVGINLASDWQSFRAALCEWGAPGQNFVYADVEGNIGYQATGRLPIRAVGHLGEAPVPGWTGEYEWQGFIPFDELPALFNPEWGYIATANNKVVSDDYAYLLSYDWVPGYRVRRITDLLDADDSLTVVDVQDIQAQTYSLPAEVLRPYLLAIEPENDLQAEALAQVEAWDLKYEIDSVGASIYELWYKYLADNTLGDEIRVQDKGLARGYSRNVRRHVPVMVNLMAEADAAWFDDVTTPDVESRDDIVRRSLAQAVDWLSDRYGRDPGKWEWGRLHTMTFEHTPLGQSGIAPLERVFNSKTVPVPGDRFSVNMASFGWNPPYKVGFGCSQRMIVDLGELDAVLAVNSTGQSGHLFHPQRDDQIPLWQAVEYRGVPFTRDAVEESARDVLVLMP